MSDSKLPEAAEFPEYTTLLLDVSRLLEHARQSAGRAVNAVMTATYWQIGRRIVEHEQGGATRAGYGEALLVMLAADLTKRFNRGFSVDRLETARLFYLAYPGVGISATPSRKLVPGPMVAQPRTSQAPPKIGPDLAARHPHW